MKLALIGWGWWGWGWWNEWYLFAPVVIETSGKQTLSFLKDLACRVCKVSGEVQSFLYLLQCLTVTVQRGNADSVRGSEDCLVFEVSDTNYSMYVFYVCILCIISLLFLHLTNISLLLLVRK